MVSRVRPALLDIIADVPISRAIPDSEVFVDTTATLRASPDAAVPTLRQIQRIVRGRPTSDGAGVKLTRVIGQPDLDMIDPFLMLDEFRSDSAGDYIAGFPEHPHRGFETVTYMLAGRMRHGDNQGNSGLLTPGSVQWMTAGRGILHSEMPEQENGLMWGFQLWVNLPAKDKMTAPRYQDIAPEAIPETSPVAGATVRVIAGSLNGVAGPVSGIATEPVYFDVRLQAGAAVELPLPATHNGFAYVYQGQARIGEGASEQLVRGDLGVLGKGDGLKITTGDAPARLIVVAGKPLNEPVAKYGPFVMNTPQQIVQAVEDFRAGRF
ncbi:MAG: pirin family protein [Xanthomonadaceae bacterium]|nr:pirin family protein [Xanthomonadaceae bacterium]MDE1961182.1 pirin family protein [Xanthomonadaceae bacterium]